MDKNREREIDERRRRLMIEALEGSLRFEEEREQSDTYNLLPAYERLRHYQHKLYIRQQLNMQRYSP